MTGHAKKTSQKLDKNQVTDNACESNQILNLTMASMCYYKCDQRSKGNCH